jgi:hypothetical protein
VLKNVDRPLQMLTTTSSQFSYAGFSIMPRAATEVGVLAGRQVRIPRPYLYIHTKVLMKPSAVVL